MGVMVAIFISSGIPSIKHLMMMFIIGTAVTLWHCFTKFESIGTSLHVFDGDLLSSCMVSLLVCLGQSHERPEGELLG